LSSKKGNAEQSRVLGEAMTMSRYNWDRECSHRPWPWRIGEMQCHIPSSWKDVKIENIPTEDIKMDVEKRKRKRSHVNKAPSIPAQGGPAPKHQKINMDTRKQELYTALDSIQLPATADKRVVVQKSVSNYTSDVPSNQLIKGCVGQCLPVLPMQSDKLDKMLLGMTKNLEQIVTESSYRATLKGACPHSITYTNDIRSVSKSYEDTFLRQCVGGNERPCVRGVDCECMQIDPTQPFIGVEYTLPWETRNEARRGMCLPCSRATTQVLFYDIVHSGVHVNGLIQRFYNEHSKPGEYRLSAMLVCPPGGPIQNLPMPIVRHQRNAYSVYKDKNILYMKQMEVDFC
jgi:hypothetical protein